MDIRPSILIIESGKLLTLKYNYSGNNVYALPGGNLEFGERMEDALKRELIEEIGLSVSVGSLAFVAEVHQRQKDTLHMVFNGEIENGTPVLNPKETSALAVEWLLVSELEQFSLYPNISKQIKGKEPLADTLFLGEISQPWY